MENNYTTSTAPVGQLSTKRGLLKYILLSFVTFGIYGIVAMSSVSSDINTIASRYDGKKTMNYWLLVLIVTPITFGIAAIVWCHKISNRIGAEMRRRGLPHAISAGTYWGWNVLGALIGIGPFIYIHKLCKAMNTLAAHYNTYG